MRRTLAIAVLAFLSEASLFAQAYGYLPLYTTATLPPCGVDQVNRVVFDSTDGRIKLCNGSSWIGPKFSAADAVPGTMSPLASLGTGTPDSNMFLRGDGAWSAPSSNPWVTANSTSDAAESTAAADTTVAGLSLTVSASTNYVIRCLLTTSAAAATTGVQITVSGPASPIQITIGRNSCASATSGLYASLNAYGRDSRTASGGTTRCVEEVLINLRNGANAGNVTFAVRSEINGSAVTIFTGSWCEMRSY